MSDKKSSKYLKTVSKLWEMGELSWKLKGKQLDIYNHLKNDPKDISTVLVSRQFGKCIAEGTMIPTTKGLKPIQDIQVGEYVYGYNEDGSISEVRVDEVHDQGVKDVVDLIHNKKIYATVTEDHRFLVYNPATDKEEVKPLKEIMGHEKIRREFIEIPCGEIEEPQAYAIGALLGDGCSRQGTYNIHISSNDEEVVLKVKDQLNCKYHYKQNNNNFTWVLSNNKKLDRRRYSGKRQPKPTCGLYDEWCAGRYAHEKIADLSVVKKWNRRSCLDFLAGVVDTDGSIFEDHNILKFSISSQSLSILEACQFIIKQLFFVEVNIYTDNREKYKNGPVYMLNLSNNLHCKRIVKELSPYIQTERKKWKSEYSFLLENNTNPKHLGVKTKNKRKMKCWDLGINNDTHLFVMDNGLITHNSFTLLLMATELCIKNPGSIVKYVCPKQNMVTKIIKPRMRDIIEDCPEHLKPEWKVQEKIWLFPNGSEIQVAGTDNGNYDNIRGGSAHLCIVDEAGFCDELETVVFSVLAPTTDTTGGRILLASTPNDKDPNHDFHEYFVFPAEISGNLIKYILYDSPMVDEKQIQRIIDRYPGGVDNKKFRCEYLCEIQTTSELTVIPEYTDNEENVVIEDYKLPDFFDAYVSMDVGFRDLTVALFGYYDFQETTLYIIDEIVMNGPSMTTDVLAKELQHREDLLFFDEMKTEKIKPYMRIMDNDLKLINDLAALHDLYFIATAKDNKEAAINQVRMWMQQGKIKIHERCVNLRYHVKHAQWDKNRKKFKHLKGDVATGLETSHADGLDALIYMIRNINEGRNPFPDDYGVKKGPNIFNSGRKVVTSAFQSIADVMTNRKVDK